MTSKEFLLASKNIRRALIARSEELGIPIKYACSETYVSYDKFITYLNTDNDRLDFDEHDVLRVFGFYNMSLRFTLVTDKSKDDNLRNMKAELFNKYEKA